MSFLEKIKDIISKKKEVLTATTIKTSTTKQSITSCCTLKLSSKTEQIKKEIDEELKAKLKKYVNAPEKLIQYLQLKGIKLYRIKNAEKFLMLFNEEEGFISPLRGYKAIILNLILNKSFGLTTKEFMVFDCENVEIYTIARAIYKYYGFKRNLPGYDYHSQEIFKKLYGSKKDAPNVISNFSAKEVLSCKEALARDVESINFTIALSVEYEKAKKALKKIKEEASANI